MRLLEQQGCKPDNAGLRWSQPAEAIKRQLAIGRIGRLPLLILFTIIAAIFWASAPAPAL